jgi:hypothetical protein
VPKLTAKILAFISTNNEPDLGCKSCDKIYNFFLKVHQNENLKINFTVSKLKFVPLR